MCLSLNAFNGSLLIVDFFLIICFLLCYNEEKKHFEVYAFATWRQNMSFRRKIDDGALILDKKSEVISRFKSELNSAANLKFDIIASP